MLAQSSGATRFYRCFSTRSYKQCTKQVVHPYVNEPEHVDLIPRYATAALTGRQIYIPKNYYNDLATEATRSGDYLGADFPYGFLGKEKIWRNRKYNVVINTVPNSVSTVKCVTYYHRLQVWAAHWFENGIHRSRWFRCAYGFRRAKNAAEIFITDLVSFGRVDNMKTSDQKLMDLEKIKMLRAMKTKRFEFIRNRKL